MSESSRPEAPSHFLREIVASDLQSGRRSKVVTRFPPEPNGFLHIGHAKSICLNFGIAQEFGGVCHLRMDDTNPTKEDADYVAGIKRDVRWLGFEWGDKEFAASQYFGQMYAWAVQLVERGRAYVDDLSEDEIRAYRGTVTEPGRPSPWRDRPVAENLDLLARMRAGEFPDGARVLRAKGDLAAPNMKMRDPLIYRIRHVAHHATSEPWAIWPMYDYAHCLSDYIEGITHSFCTLEFEVNRELYDWFLEILELPHPRPRQYEFARLAVAHTMTSKRRLLRLVTEGTVTGWDDPRMPTLSGMRRKGVTPEAIRLFAERVGVARADNLVDPSLLEASIRDDLDERCPRRMAVLRPLEVILANHPAETVHARDWPESTGKDGSRAITFGDRVWIDRDDFAENPPPGWHRLSPGGVVRLRYACVIRCDAVEREGGEIVRLRCTVVEGKAKGIVHWVPGDAPVAEVRLFERLFDSERPDQEEDWLATLNPTSKTVLRARVEPSLAGAAPGERFQLERVGFFFVDPVDSRPNAPVLHRTVGLKDTYTKHVDQVVRPTHAAPQPVAARERSPEALAWIARGVGAEEADVLAAEPELGRLVTSVAAAAPLAPSASFVVHEVRKHPGTPDPAHVATLVNLVHSGRITMAVARRAVAAVLGEGVDPEGWIAENGLDTLADDGALAEHVAAVLAERADKVAAYRAGKTGLLGMFVGAVLQRTGGRADATRVKELLAAALSG